MLFLLVALYWFGVALKGFCAPGRVPSKPGVYDWSPSSRRAVTALVGLFPLRCVTCLAGPSGKHWKATNC